MANLLYKSPESYAAMMAWYETALERLPVAYEALTVPTRQGDTHVLVTGEPDAPPLLMIHGLGGCGPMWRPQIAALAPYYHIYAIDTIGQPGRSASVAPPFSGDAYNQWLVDTLDALQIEQTPIIGLSLGGWLSIKLSLYAPQRVARLILISPPGLARLRPNFFIRCAPAVLNLRPISDAALRRLAYDFLAPVGSGLELHPEVEEAMCLVLRHFNLGGYSSANLPAPSQLRSIMRDVLHFLFPISARQLEGIHTPTYLLVGEHEALFNPQTALQYAQKHLPNLRAAELVNNAGHGLNYDRPNYVNDLLRRYLES